MSIHSGVPPRCAVNSFSFEQLIVSVLFRLEIENLTKLTEIQYDLKYTTSNFIIVLVQYALKTSFT